MIELGVGARVLKDTVESGPNRLGHGVDSLEELLLGPTVPGTAMTGLPLSCLLPVDVRDEYLHSFVCHVLQFEPENLDVSHGLGVEVLDDRSKFARDVVDRDHETKTTRSEAPGDGLSDRACRGLGVLARVGLVIEIRQLGVTG